VIINAQTATRFGTVSDHENALIRSSVAIKANNGNRRLTRFPIEVLIRGITYCEKRGGAA
jgi:hypothetical protein